METHSHPHLFDENCHCIVCRPLERPCYCKDCKALVASRMAAREMHPIPVSAAQAIADLYGYDQVVIVARRVGGPPQPNGEHVTTYGVSNDHAATARIAGDYIKFEVMRWRKDQVVDCGNDLSTSGEKSDRAE
jgi:hypothetical protein